MSGEAQVWYNSFDTSIERSEAVVEELRANGDLLSPEPYWDPTLAADPQLRLKFWKRPVELGLGAWRRRRRGKVSCFFVKKVGDDQERFAGT